MGARFYTGLLVIVLGTLAGTVILLGILGGMMALVNSARAHDAPTGWSYPQKCCSTVDCRMVPRTAISEPNDKRGTYQIVRTGEQIAPGDARIMDSPDGEFHWCSIGGWDDSSTICLFVPPRGF